MWNAYDVVNSDVDCSSNAYDLTSASRNPRVHLLEHHYLIILQIGIVVPLMFVAVVHPRILVEPVVEHDVLRHYVLLVVDCTRIAQCEWPIVSGTLERLPEAVRIRVGSLSVGPTLTLPQGDWDTFRLSS